MDFGDMDKSGRAWMDAMIDDNDTNHGFNCAISREPAQNNSPGGQVYVILLPVTTSFVPLLVFKVSRDRLH